MSDMYICMYVVYVRNVYSVGKVFMYVCMYVYMYGCNVM